MASKKGVSEKKFQAKVRKYLEERGAYVVVHTATGYGRSGIPDLLCCFKGCFFAVEVKREGGKVTPHQERELAAVTTAGGWAIDLYPSKWEDFCGLLDIIEDLAIRNQSSAKRNYRKSVEAQDEIDAGAVAQAADIPADALEKIPLEETITCPVCAKPTVHLNEVCGECGNDTTVK